MLSIKLTNTLFFPSYFTMIILIAGCKKDFRKSDADFIEPAESKSMLMSTTGGRYIDDLFGFSRITYPYRLGIPSFTGSTDLYLDVYTPTQDADTSRACFIFLYGGSFLFGSKNDGYVQTICSSLAKKGYVTIAISYRLGWNTTSLLSLYEAEYRAIQDARAAVRAVKQEARLIGVDTSNIFLGGESAGAYSVLGAAYLDQDEANPYFLATLGPLDGNNPGDYPGYSNKVKGVVNMEGWIYDTSWIEAGDAPLINFYGTADVFYTNTTITGPGNAPVQIPIDNGIAINQRIAQIALNPIGLLQPPLYPGGMHESVPTTYLQQTIDVMCNRLNDLIHR